MEEEPGHALQRSQNELNEDIDRDFGVQSARRNRRQELDQLAAKHKAKRKAEGESIDIEIEKKIQSLRVKYGGFKTALQKTHTDKYMQLRVEENEVSSMRTQPTPES